MKNDLKHLRRSELIDLIYEMKKQEIELQTRLDEAEAKLQAREITIEKAGSIADAAVQLSGVFQAAQEAADSYLKSIKAKEKELRLHEGELNVMELLWSNKVLAAKDISKIIKEYIGWEKNTTYTVIKRLIDKGVVSREDPGFQCRAEISKKEVQKIETNALLSKMFNGSLANFITEYLADRKLTTEEVLELQRVLNKQI